MKLTGITLIRNGEDLGYPWKECIENMSMVCDEVVVNVDETGTDDTLDIVNNICWDNVVPFHSQWDMRNTKDGRELAYQINYPLSTCDNLIDTDWILYLQADEFVHPKDGDELRAILQRLPSNVTQLELYRTYFWQSLTQRNIKHEIWLGRVFRPGTHIVGGDGMYLERLKGDVARSNLWIYHYSRMGSEEEVTRRVRTLDTLFHDKETIDTFGDFSYNKDLEAMHYFGTHPWGVESFYKERK